MVRVSAAKFRVMSLLMANILCFFIGTAWLASARQPKSQSSTTTYPLQSDADYTIVPDEMNLAGDVAVCDDVILDPIVASWCNGIPPGSIILGVDPGSAEPADWGGGQASTSLYIGNIASPTAAVIKVTWLDLDGKGIHSPHPDKVATVKWDGVPIWSKATRDIGTFNDYFALEHGSVLATAVLTQSTSHTLVVEVPANTAWDISSITIGLYAMPETLHGIAYSPFQDCQNPHWGPFPTEAEIEADMARMFHMSNGVRTYSSRGVIGDIPRIALQYDLPVTVGAWLGREQDTHGNPVENKNREEIDALVALANDPNLPNVDFVIVGNEVLLRGDLTEDELIAYIEEVKSKVNVPVTTAEITGILKQHPRVIEAVDYLMIHTYPYWEAQPIEGAAEKVAREYLDWQETYFPKRIVIGETGWPSAGPPNGPAVPSLDNQRRFFYEFLKVAEEHEIEFYYFDGFDELWKREGGVGSHWGYMDSARVSKHAVQSVLMPAAELPSPSSYLSRLLPAGYISSHLAYLPVLFKKEPLNVDKFVVFDEYAGQNNHFAPSGWMGDREDLAFYECDRSNPYSGQVAARVSYDPQGPEGWAGIYWQEPDGNWGDVEEAGYDLDDATYLRFYARGENGGERVKFLMGGIWGSHPDSQQPALSTDVITLTKEWSKYDIALRGRDLSYVIGGFAFVTDRCLSDGGPITFYLDKIHYVMAGDTGPPPPIPLPEIPYSFDVYRDKDKAGNHYVPSGWMGDIGDIQLDECWREEVHTGSTSIKVGYSAQGNGPEHACDSPFPCNWSGVYWQEPANNWGEQPGGYDLSGARAVTFWAKGENGGERISFKVGGIACDSDTVPYPDSLCPIQILDPDSVSLTTTWQAYTIPLHDGLDLSRVMGGFLWAASKEDNPEGATFYLDDIQYLFNVDIPPQPHSIYNGPRLASGYDMGVNTSGNLTDWVTDLDGSMRMDYPPGQSWGAAFITVGPPTDPPSPGQDLSSYEALSLELRGEAGGEKVWIGIKDSTDPDNSKETKILVSDLTTEWQTFSFPLSKFVTADLTRLYVVTEFVFEIGTPAETVYFRNIRYLP